MDITKGPWKLINQIDDYLDLEGDGIRICSFYIGDDNPDLKETRANAQAILAVPELIETLEAIIARIDGEWDNPALIKFGPLSISSGQNNDVKLIASNALDKIKGKE